MIRPVFTRRHALVPVAEALARWTGRVLQRANPKGWN